MARDALHFESCSAIAEPRTETILGPMVCGHPAVGPHPDPEISYRQPLCRPHLAAAVAALEPIEPKKYRTVLHPTNPNFDGWEEI